MLPEITEQLNKPKDGNAFHEEMLQHVRKLIKRSHSDMSEWYQSWDIQDQIFRGERPMDKEDVAQERKGKPVKFIVGNTYAQVMTFTSFLFLMFKQNRRFFELLPTGNEDYGTKQEDSELLLERDLKKSAFDLALFQHILDTARFGLGVLENAWTKDVARVKVSETKDVVDGDGIATSVTTEVYKEVTRHEGNVVRAISPYRFFPDTRLPLTDHQRGEFCAYEEDYSKTELRKMEANGEVAGIEHIEDRDTDFQKNRRGHRFSFAYDGKKDGDKNTVVVTKMQVKIVPKEFKVDGKPLGDETFPVMYHVWIANDSRIIRIEEDAAWHGQFNVTVSHFTPDMHRMLNEGLAALVQPLQDTISWFINSHITSIRRVIKNRLIINPSAVEAKSLDGEGDILIKKGLAGVPMDRIVSQLKVQDVTSGNMVDAEMLNKTMEMVTGVNGNAMGQYNSGRRSATEARSVTAGAAGRLKVHASLIWEGSFAQLGKMMLSNLRQELSFGAFQRVIGQSETIQERYTAFKGTPEEVASCDDFFVFDSTLNSEKGFMAQSLQELLVAVMSNPMAAQQLDLSANALLEEVQRLRGSGDIRRFSLSARVNAGKEAPPMPPQPPTV